MEATVVPFPMPEITPPETKIYFVLRLLNGLVLSLPNVFFFDRGTIYIIKPAKLRQWVKIPTLAIFCVIIDL